MAEAATLTLSDFLLARIAEDELVGLRARDNAGRFGSVDHVTRWHPLRVLAECEAKRRIVSEHGNDHGDCRVCAEDESFSEDSEGNREFYRTAKSFPCPTLRLLAQPYADHPDYREAWRP